MTSRDFAYWLQGFFEITNTAAIDESQTRIIKKHLEMVFAHEIDPSYGDKKEQHKLSTIHSDIGSISTVSTGSYFGTKDPLIRC